MEIEEEENGCNKLLKRKKPLDLNWEHILPTSSGDDDDRRPELVVTSKNGGGGEVDEPTEDLNLMIKSEREIKETIVRLKGLQNLAHNLPDNGDKLKANLRRHEDELQRRIKLQLDKVLVLICFFPFFFLSMEWFYMLYNAHI